MSTGQCPAGADLRRLKQTRRRFGRPTHYAVMTRHSSGVFYCLQPDEQLAGPPTNAQGQAQCRPNADQGPRRGRPARQRIPHKYARDAMPTDRGQKGADLRGPPCSRAVHTLFAAHRHRHCEQSLVESMNYLPRARTSSTKPGTQDWAKQSRFLKNGTIIRE
jgi:hypothetical protein